MTNSVFTSAVLILAVVTMSLYAVSSVDAHIAVDEVARHGGAGYDSEQLTHEHPHDRTIWYEIESGNYTGDAVDRYEQRLIGQAPPPVIPDPEPVPEPEPEPVPANYERMDMTVMFEIDGGTVTCPNGRTVEDVDIVMVTNSVIRHADLIYTTETTSIFDKHRAGLVKALSADSRIESSSLVLVDGLADTQNDMAHLVAVVDHINGSLHFCPGSEDMSISDIYIECDGSGIEMVPRHSNGYSVTATDEQSSAACHFKE